MVAAAAMASMSRRAHASPARACAAARRCVVSPARNGSHRPAASSPRVTRVATINPQSAPTSDITPVARQVTKPPTVSIRYGTPNRAWSPVFPARAARNCCRPAAVGARSVKPTVWAYT